MNTTPALVRTTAFTARSALAALTALVISTVLRAADPAPAAAAETPLRIIQIEPTVLFANRDPLAQIAWLSVENTTAAPVACEAVVTVGGAAAPAQKLTLAPGLSRHDLFVPDMAKPANVTVELRIKDKAAATRALPWQPQRKWKIFVVKSSHEDIGYEDYLWVKQAGIARNMDLARRLCAPASAAGPVAEGASATGGYRYFLETLLFPRYYMAERSESAWRALAGDYVKKNTMPLAGQPNGAHTHWMDYEELARFTYPARREYKDRFGLDIDTFVMVDNPSFSWSSAQAMAAAGVRYAVRFGQPFRTKKQNDYASTKLPAIFWWEGPDAQSRVLFTWRHHYGINFWFGQTGGGGYSDLSALAAENVNREVLSVQKESALGPYPYDALLIPSYQDHETPVWDNRALRRWQTLYRYPEITIAGPRDFMAYMEKNHGDKLPVLRGDMNNFSADYATIDPDAQSWKRTASRLVPLAESLAAIAATLDPAFTLLPKNVDRAYTRLIDFDEHSWPTSPAPGPVHRFNAQWGKHLEGGRALNDAQALLRRAWDPLAARITTGDLPELMILNPLAQPRTDIVTLARPLPDCSLIDSVTGETVALQTLADGRQIFVAENVPAFGYKTYRIAPPAPPPTAQELAARAAAKRAAFIKSEKERATKARSTAKSNQSDARKPAPEAARPTFSDDFISNEYYTIKFDKFSGAITSLYDRQLNKELIDPRAKYQFNQLVWISKRTKEGVNGSDYAPAKGASLKASGGDVAAEMITTIKDSKLGNALITQTVRIYAGLRRIDILNDLRHVGALHSEKSADRYKENIFYAFPLKIDRFTARAEYPGGVVRPFDDQLRWGSHDYLAVNRWADVSNKDYGITLAPWNAPIVHFGEIRYNQFSLDYKPKKSHLYSYAWSNRMAGLLALGEDDMNARFAYTLAVHDGDWNAGDATALGWSVGSPLQGRTLPPKQQGMLPAKSASFISLDAPNVQMTVLKETAQPGRGWILRLVETEGENTTVTIDAGALVADSAALCDLVENDTGPLEIKNGKLRLTLKPHAFATVRLYSKKTPPDIGAIEVAGVSDQAVKIQWKPVPGALAYHIFRSDDPDAPPTSATLAGRTAAIDFTDAGLNPAEKYYYRVAALGAVNMQSAPSAQITAVTAAKNVSPPQPLREMGVVRQGPKSLKICWEKSPEPDVARYYVFRSESVNFEPAAAQLAGVVTPGGYYLETLDDENLTPGKTYYYKVLPEDWAGNRQPASPIAYATTPKD